MTKKLVNIGQAMRKIRNTGQTIPPIDPAEIAAALGAEPISAPRAKAGSPLALFAVRQEMARRLQSSGGQRALNGATGREIPLSDHEWQQIKTIADAIATAGCTPSTGQVASVLLNLALRSVLAEMAAEKTLPPITKQQVTDHLASNTPAQ